MTTRRPRTAGLAVLPVDVVHYPTGQVVTVRGWIDASAVPGLRDRLQRVVDAGPGDVVLLLGDAEIGDATALGLLVGLHDRARRAGRRLVVSEVSDRTARLLRAAHLDRVLVGVSESTCPEPMRAGPDDGGPTGGAVAPVTAYPRS
jgi:anti-anti-sigma factor